MAVGADRATGWRRKGQGQLIDLRQCAALPRGSLLTCSRLNERQTLRIKAHAVFTGSSADRKSGIHAIFSWRTGFRGGFCRDAVAARFTGRGCVAGACHAEPSRAEPSRSSFRRAHGPGRRNIRRRNGERRQRRDGRESMRPVLRSIRRRLPFAPVLLVEPGGLERAKCALRAKFLFARSHFAAAIDLVVA